MLDLSRVTLAETKIRQAVGGGMVTVGMLEVRIMLQKVMTYAVVGLVGVAG